MKNIGVYVYRSSLGDCTNKGATSKEDGFELYSDINTAADLANVPEGSLVLIKRDLFGKDADYVIPVKYAIVIQGALRCNGALMFGGNFVYTSDSRYPDIHRRPLPVHDRFEW